MCYLACYFIDFYRVTWECFYPCQNGALAGNSNNIEGEKNL